MIIFRNYFSNLLSCPRYFKMNFFNQNSAPAISGNLANYAFRKYGYAPISRLCTFLPAHWRLILLIHDFSLVIGGKLHSEYLGFSLLVANYSRNIPFFSLAARLQTHTIGSLNIPNKSLYNASYYMCRKITSH